MKVHIRLEGMLRKADERLILRVDGLRPLEACQIHLRVSYSWCDTVLQASRSYTADEAGRLCLKGSSEDGDAAGDSMALFSELNIAKTGGYRKQRDMTKEWLRCTFSCVSGQGSCTRVLKRYFTEKNTRLAELPKDLYGHYYKQQGRKRTVIVLGGSEGRLSSLLPLAGLMTFQEMNAVALLYFDRSAESDILPSALYHIDIGYVERCVKWLKQEEQQEEIYLLGSSKGAELALLSSVYMKDIAKVAAIAPGAYVFGGIPYAWYSSWTYKGKPLPHLPLLLGGVPAWIMNMLKEWRNKDRRGYKRTYSASVALAPSFLKKRARIPLEKSTAELLLISGSDDTMWNSELFAEILVRHCRSYGKKVEWLRLACGHELYAPFIFVPDEGYGGTRRENGIANERAFQKIYAFFRK